MTDLVQGDEVAHLTAHRRYPDHPLPVPDRPAHLCSSAGPLEPDDAVKEAELVEMRLEHGADGCRGHSELSRTGYRAPRKSPMRASARTRFSCEFA